MYPHEAQTSAVNDGSLSPDCCFWCGKLRKSRVSVYSLGPNTDVEGMFRKHQPQKLFPFGWLQSGTAPPQRAEPTLVHPPPIRAVYNKYVPRHTAPSKCTAHPTPDFLYVSVIYSFLMAPLRSCPKSSCLPNLDSTLRLKASERLKITIWIRI